MTGRGIEVYIDLPLKNPYKEYYNIFHTKIFWYLANSITKCYQKVVTHPSRTPITNITLSSTPRYSGTWQIVLQNVIKKNNDPPLKNPHKEYYNIFDTEIFWYLAKSIKKNYKKSINPSLKALHKEYYNFIHTKIFWYLANSIAIYNYTY